MENTLWQKLNSYGLINKVFQMDEKRFKKYPIGNGLTVWKFTKQI